MRNIQGKLFKPLFAFMVIGLNGRIPLNTAGNLAGQTTGIPFPATGTPTYNYGGGHSHAQHLGNSVSEVDPTYALQNGFDPVTNAGDISGAFVQPGGVNTAFNTQVDNSGVDVRLTQLRSLLTGTRVTNSVANGENNFVAAKTGSGLGTPLFMPNNVADPMDTAFATDGSGNPYVLRT